MIAVGNDVVDLEDPAIAATHLRERFVARVCAGPERDALSRAANPKLRFWTLFAAKEAAYKVVCKLGPRPLFAHRKFVVADDLSRVEHEGASLKLRVETGEGWVHALVTSPFTLGLSRGATEPVPSGVEGLGMSGTWGVAALGPREDASSAARALLLRSLKLPGGEVVRAVVPASWDGHGPPQLRVNGEPSGWDISLSHDGRFVAFAAGR